MKELLRRGIDGLYIDDRTFVSRCQGSFSRGEQPNDLINRLLKPRFLVLDDLGTSKVSDFVRQCWLDLIGAAYADEKVLIVTSNLSLDQLSIRRTGLPHHNRPAGCRAERHASAYW